jgi:hypothetical protein
MTNLQTILEKDKERFLQLASAAANREEAIRICEDELGRALYSFNEEEQSDAVRQEASRLIVAAKPVLGLIDSDGETKIYQRSEYGKKAPKAKIPKMFWAALLAGIAALFASTVLMYAANHTNVQNIYPIIILSVFSSLALFAAGAKMNAVPAGSKDDITAETKIDGGRIYRTLLMTAVTIDQILDEVRNSEERAKKTEIRETKGGFDDKTLTFFSQMLEETYADRENAASQTLLTNLKFFLHERGIEAADYTDEHKNWFDRIPGRKDETLRPALVIDEQLVKKGLASGGR